MSKKIKYIVAAVLACCHPFRAGRGQNSIGSQSYVVVHCLFFLPAHRLHRTHDATVGQRPVGRNGKVAGRKPGASNDVHMDEDPRIHERL